MKVTKRLLSKLPSCYSVVTAPLRDGMYALFASEADDVCLAFDLSDPGRMRTIWEHPGGTMGMVPIPGRSGEFLAIQKFYRLWDWEESELVWVRETEDRFETFPILRLPYLHRFDILEAGGRLYLLVCGVAAHKSSLQDWSCPGVVLGGVLPKGPEEALRMETLRSDFYRNHGYARVVLNGIERGFVTCANGGFLFTPPQTAEDSWSVEKLLDGDFSDGDMADIDGDGEMEIVAISPFHGNKYSIYKQIGGVWAEVYIHPERAGFYHVATAGKLCGRMGFLGGGREGRQSLFFVSSPGAGQPFELLEIDRGQGPSNARIWNTPAADYVLAANRNVGGAVLYRIEP